jgi:hypothetical protein
LLKVLEVVFAKFGEEKRLLGRSHGFDNERLIMREEEEAATSSASFPRLEYLLPVHDWAQGNINLISVDSILSS